MGFLYWNYTYLVKSYMYTYILPICCFIASVLVVALLCSYSLGGQYIIVPSYTYIGIAIWVV